jgi:methylmalonyl-CoA mutase C-terminal domain/subunit
MLIESLAERGIKNIPILVGGIIPYEDDEYLMKIGVAKIFRPGTPLAEIIDTIKRLCPSKQNPI